MLFSGRDDFWRNLFQLGIGLEAVRDVEGAKMKVQKREDNHDKFFRSKFNRSKHQYSR